MRWFLASKFGKIEFDMILKNEDPPKSRPLNVRSWPLKLVTSTCGRCGMSGDTHTIFEGTKTLLEVFI